MRSQLAVDTTHAPARSSDLANPWPGGRERSWAARSRGTIPGTGAPTEKIALFDFEEFRSARHGHRHERQTRTIKMADGQPTSALERKWRDAPNHAHRFVSRPTGPAPAAHRFLAPRSRPRPYSLEQSLQPRAVAMPVRPGPPSRSCRSASLVNARGADSHASPGVGLAYRQPRNALSPRSRRGHRAATTLRLHDARHSRAPHAV